MGFFFLGIVALFLGLLAINGFVQADPRKLAGQIRIAGGILLLAVAGLMMFTGRWVLALPIGAFALSLLGWGGVPGFGRVGSRSRSSGHRSQVRSAVLEMELDHDSGTLRGRVLVGTHEGRELDDLGPNELKELWAETAEDAESQALLEAYLDRRHAGWREDFEANGASGQGAATRPGPMTDEEAYQVLGLAPGAGEAEIREAHRRLMKRMHPDQGGTTFLAAKINEAKDRLLRSHGSSGTHY